MRKILLYVGGFICFAFVIVHILFWKLFNWNEELTRISAMNRGLMLTLNAAVTYFFVFAAFLSVYLAGLKEFKFLEKTVLVLIAGMYFLRIVCGFFFFQFTMLELACWILCFFAISCYLPALRRPRTL
ncbi:MAG: hypothetical protein GY765_39765 [bacterium]|nr:hypothetical protein [bacterium]